MLIGMLQHAVANHLTSQGYAVRCVCVCVCLFANCKIQIKAHLPYLYTPDYNMTGSDLLFTTVVKDVCRLNHYGSSQYYSIPITCVCCLQFDCTLRVLRLSIISVCFPQEVTPQLYVSRKTGIYVKCVNCLTSSYLSVNVVKCVLYKKCDFTLMY